MAGSLLATFLAAGQASSSILLVGVYGVLAAEFKILDGPSIKRISALCVRMLLPALLVTRIGSELEDETWSNYLPVFAWAIVYNAVSLLFGLAVSRSSGWPRWLAAVTAFNNTTSLPLLLMRALDSTGILKRLIVGDDTTAKAITRAQSYFLASSIIGNCLTFAVGPRLMRPEPDLANQALSKSRDRRDVDSHPASPAAEPSEERDSLLPHFELDEQPQPIPQPPRLRRTTPISILHDVFNEPTIGALLGLFIGVIPPLHRAFFSPTNEGGIFTPWLTASLANIGQAFVPLQVIIVGVTLSQSFHQGHFSSSPNTTTGPSRLRKSFPNIFILAVRFVLWPLVSLPLIYLLATNTRLLADDPVLWFSLMLMPAGPPAMKLIAMANVSGADEGAKISVARVLAISYVCVPLLSFSVVAALRAVESAMKVRGLA